MYDVMTTKGRKIRSLSTKRKTLSDRRNPTKFQYSFRVIYAESRSRKLSRGAFKIQELPQLLPQQVFKVVVQAILKSFLKQRLTWAMENRPCCLGEDPPRL